MTPWFPLPDESCITLALGPSFISHRASCFVAAALTGETAMVAATSDNTHGAAARKIELRQIDM
jgi:hypothetical protein